VLVALYGAATAFFMPAFEAIVPSVVAKSELAQANSLDQFVRPGALRLVGPALGGSIVAAVGSGGAFAVDAASFLASMAAIAALHPVPAAVATTSSTSAAIADGIRFVRSQVWLWATLVSAAVAYLAFMGPTEALLPFVVKNELHASAAALGLVFAAGGVGAIGAALIMGQHGQPRRDVTFMYACWTLATLAVAGYGLGRSAPQLMIACLVFNALEAAGTIVWATIKQRHVPSALLGRVSSLDWMISIGLLPISYGLTAPVASLVGVRATLVGAAAIGAAVTLSALFFPGMRDIEGHGRTALAARS
jgi:DHA3 family tetracycline resistance protein-like MFS transporter